MRKWSNRLTSERSVDQYNSFKKQLGYTFNLEILVLDRVLCASANIH